MTDLAVTREMISAAHRVTMEHNEIVLSWRLLERIYLAMAQAAPKKPCATCESLARTVMMDQMGRA